MVSTLMPNAVFLHRYAGLSREPHDHLADSGTKDYNA